MGAADQAHDEVPDHLAVKGMHSYVDFLYPRSWIYLTSTRLEMFSCKGMENVTIYPTAALAILLSIFKDFTYIISQM